MLPETAAAWVTRPRDKGDYVGSIRDVLARLLLIAAFAALIVDFDQDELKLLCIVSSLERHLTKCVIEFAVPKYVVCYF